MAVASIPKTISWVTFSDNQVLQRTFPDIQTRVNRSVVTRIQVVEKVISEQKNKMAACLYAESYARDRHLRCVKEGVKIVTYQAPHNSVIPIYLIEGINPLLILSLEGPIEASKLRKRVLPHAVSEAAALILPK